MSARTPRRLLLAAFALSILLHLLAGRFVRWEIPTPVEPPDSLTTHRITIARIPKRTPPPQTPQPVPTGTPAPPHARKVAVAVPHISNGKRPAVLRPAAPVPTIAPTPRAAATRLPTPSAHGPCVTPDAPAAVRTTPSPPDVPDEARKAAKTGVVSVRVGISESGSITGAAIDGSSGSDALDQVAVSLAKGATYSAPLAQCKPVAGTYLFRVRFATP